jgi:hypothetical protein
MRIDHADRNCVHVVLTRADLRSLERGGELLRERDREGVAVWFRVTADGRRKGVVS